MKIKKSIVSIGKTAYTVIQFNYTPPKDKDASVKRRHFIEMLERYEPMINDVDNLIKRINKTKNLIESRKVVYQYLPTFKETIKSLEGISYKTIDINCEGKSIVYLTGRSSRLESDNLRINLSDSINKFYIISPKDEEFQFNINNKIYTSSDIKWELTSLDIKNLLYYLSYEKYCEGNTTEALDILSISLKDKFLTRLALNAFTAKERENCKGILLKAAYNKKVKLQPKVWTRARLIEGIKKDDEFLENAPCLMKLLDIFEKNGDKFIPVHPKEYKRIGKKVVDNYNVFKADNAARLETDFRNLVFSKEKINISIRYEIPGFVTINPRQAKATGFNTNIFNAKMYREQTIIKDGDINIEKFQASVSKNTLEYLKGLEIDGLFTILKNNDSKNDNFTLIELNILKLPVLSRGYILKSDSLDHILDIYYEQRVAECKQKVIKYFIKKQVKNTEFKDKKYSKKQAELLESYGLDSKGIYGGVDNNVIREESEKYECRFFEFAIKGFSTLPKVEAVLEKMDDSKKKLNMPEIVMKRYIEYLMKDQIIDFSEKLNKLLEEQKSLIKKNTRILAQIRLSKAISGGWWKGLKLDSKENYLYVRGDMTLIINVIRKVIQI